MSWWKLETRREVLKTIPFVVEELEHSDGQPYHRLLSPDWVNVLPITTDGKALLIRQPRAGTLDTVLETPGGAVDPEEHRDPTLAAARELEEETGYVSQRFIPLASLNPNPALHNNKVHLFLALGCMPAPERKRFPDPGESIEICPTPVAELGQLVRLGRMNHALCALCVMLAQNYLGESSSTTS